VSIEFLTPAPPLPWGDENQHGGTEEAGFTEEEEGRQSNSRCGGTSGVLVQNRGIGSIQVMM
jgi:hypothetical protein